MLSATRIVTGLCLLGLLALGALACGGASNGAGDPRADDVVVPPRTHLAAFAGVGGMVPMRLVDDVQLEIGELIEVRLASGKHSVAVDGERFYSVAHDGTVTEHTPFDANEDARSVELPFSLASRTRSTRAPADNANGERRPVHAGSVWARDRHVFVGTEDRVTYINFNSATPTTVEVWHEQIGKPVDYFVPAGKTLVAIDNVTWPRYAITIDIATIDQPEVLHKTLLPNPGAGSYDGGVNLDESTIALIATSGGAYGMSNQLIRSTVGNDTLTSKRLVDERFVYEAAEEENRFVPVPQDPDEIVGGTYSAFRGIDRTEERIFIAAAQRGILSAPRDDPAALVQHELDDPCLDVRALDGDVVVALLGEWDEADRTLVTMRWDAETGQLIELSRNDLDVPALHLAKQ